MFKWFLGLFKKDKEPEKKTVEDYNLYADGNGTYKEDEARNIIQKLRSVKYGRSIIAAQIGANIKRRAWYEAGVEYNHVIDCKYLVPLPNEVNPQEDAYVFYGDPTRYPFDTEKVRKVFEDEIEKIKKYYPEMKPQIAFIKPEDVQK